MLPRELKALLQRLIISMKHALRKLLSSLRPSKKTLLTIASVAIITIIAHIMIAEWLTRTEIINIPSVFNTPSVTVIHVWGVEAHGGDLTTINGTSTINWGIFYPGETKTVSFYVRSISNMPINLAYNTNWTPNSLARYMSLKCNYNGTTLSPEQQIPVFFSLTLSASQDAINYIITNNVTTFNLNISIFTQEPNP